jgi:hypothetical protein
MYHKERLLTTMLIPQKLNTRYLEKEAPMTLKRSTLLSIFLLLPACFANKTQNAMHTFIIQAPFDPSVITKLQEKVGPVISNIITKEAGVEWDEKTPFFFFKKRAAITIYYVNDIYDDGESFLYSAVDSMHNIPAPQDVTITTKTDFFGEPKKEQLALLDLVVMIDDPNNGLAQLNVEMKQAMHMADEQYATHHNHPLYDRSKSERFPYLPHLSLGHLRANHLKHVMNDESEKTDKIIERIKQRIIEVVSHALAEMSVEERKIAFDTLNIYDVKKRVYIKEVSIK